MDDEYIQLQAASAADVFNNGFNCAQSVLSALGPGLGLQRELCFKLGSPFGAGIARRQEICGAVAGAIMVLGLEHGRGENDGESVKESASRITNEFFNRFDQIHGSHQCRNLLGLDMNTPDGKDQMVRENFLQTKCLVYVRDAVRITLELRNKITGGDSPPV